MDFNLSGNMDMLVSFAAGLLTTALGWLIKNAATRVKVSTVIDTGLQIASVVVAEVSKHTANTVDDKIALGLAKFVEYTHSKGVIPTADQVAQAKQVINDIHLKSLVTQAAK